MNLLGYENYLILATMIFIIGLIGVMYRKNIIVILMSIELMLNASNLVMLTMSRMIGNLDGHIFVFFTMLVAAAEATIGLALIVMIYRKYKTIDISKLDKLNG